MAEYRGNFILVVNVASRCGFTPQYAGLQMLYQHYHARGFTVLAFPCNQFGEQEPADATQIGQFCRENYHVDFPLFAKAEVNGPNAHPLYQYLTGQRRGVLGTRAIKWNFTKFLLDREGRVVRRFGSLTKPESIAKQIESLL